MKAKDLKTYLNRLPREEVVDFTVELYKHVQKKTGPEALPESLLKVLHKRGKKKEQKSLASIAQEIKDFTASVRRQHYFYPNDFISKKKRGNWSRLVRKWYKALRKTNRKDQLAELRAETLEHLYSLLCESSYCEYFYCDDAFIAINISQVDFYRTVLVGLAKAKRKEEIVKTGIELIIHNAPNTYTLYSHLMDVLIHYLGKPSLWRQAIHTANGLRSECELDRHNKSLSQEDYQHEEMDSNLVELIYRLHMALGEPEQAIAFFKEHYYERNAEVQLYVLVRLLQESGQPTYLQQELETAVAQGIELRSSLEELLKNIQHPKKDLVTFS